MLFRANMRKHNFLKIAVGEVEDFTCPDCSMISVRVLQPDFV